MKDFGGFLGSLGVVCGVDFIPRFGEGEGGVVLYVAGAGLPRIGFSWDSWDGCVVLVLVDLLGGATHEDDLSKEQLSLVRSISSVAVFHGFSVVGFSTEVA